MPMENAKELLLARKAELDDILRVSEGAQAPVELDQSRVGRLSRMDAMQGQAMALDTVRRRKNELSRIMTALLRVENGDFGYCVNCDEEIRNERLLLDPSTPLCIDCASLDQGN